MKVKNPIFGIYFFTFWGCSSIYFPPQCSAFHQRVSRRSPSKNLNSRFDPYSLNREENGVNFKSKCIEEGSIDFQKPVNILEPVKSHNDPVLEVRKHTPISLTKSLKTFVVEMLKRSPDLDKEIFSIAFPALATLAIDPLMSIVDVGFVGRLGAAELGGVGLAGILLNFFFALFNFLQALSVPLVAERWNRDYPEDKDSKASVSQVIGEISQIALVVGLGCSILLYTAAPSLLKFCSGQASIEMTTAALDYMRIRSIVAPFILLNYALGGAFRGLGDLTTPFYIACMSNLTNLVGDFVLINKLGWGVKGAAIATSVSQLFSALAGVFILAWKRFLRLKSFFGVPQKSLVKEVLLGSVWSVRTISILSTFTLASSFATRSGVITGAAHEILRQLWLFQAMALDALAVAAQIMIAKALGKGDKYEARVISTRLLQIGLLCGVFLGAGTQMAAPYLPRLFSSNIEVAACFRQTLPIMTVAQPINALVFVYDGIAAASKDYGYSAKSIFCAGSFAWGILWILRLGTDLKLSGVWLGINALMIGRAAALGSRFLSHKGPIPPLRWEKRTVNSPSSVQ